MATQLDGFEIVPPIRRNEIAKIDKHGRVYLPLFVKKSLGISNFKHEAYQVYFNKTSWLALVRFIEKAGPNDHSYPVLWSNPTTKQGIRDANGEKTLRVNLAPLVGLYRLPIRTGEVGLSWDEEKKELTVDLSSLKKLGAMREVKALPG